MVRDIKLADILGEESDEVKRINIYLNSLYNSAKYVETTINKKIYKEDVPIFIIELNKTIICDSIWRTIQTEFKLSTTETDELTIYFLEKYYNLKLDGYAVVKKGLPHFKLLKAFKYPIKE